jgi:hypothetical protein
VDALLSDLRTLEAQWRKWRDENTTKWDVDPDDLALLDAHADGREGAADDLAALLARLEGK